MSPSYVTPATYVVDLPCPAPMTLLGAAWANTALPAASSNSKAETRAQACSTRWMGLMIWTPLPDISDLPPEARPHSTPGALHLGQNFQSFRSRITKPPNPDSQRGGRHDVLAISGTRLPGLRHLFAQTVSCSYRPSAGRKRQCRNSLEHPPEQVARQVTLGEQEPV